jgi:hypothetical protein
VAEHVSDLVLDEIAAGLGVAEESRTHVKECSECSARLKRIVEAHENAKGGADYQRVFQRLKVRSPTPRHALARFAFLGAPLAVAAAVVILVINARTAPIDSRLKGASSLQVVRADDGALIATAHVGDRVALVAGPAGHAFGLFLGIDEQGAIEVLWPVKAEASGAVPAGAAKRLDPPFEVTPGSFAIHAFFSDQPISTAAATKALSAACDEARKAGRSPLTAVLPLLPTEAAHARAQLTVEPR